MRKTRGACQTSIIPPKRGAGRWRAAGSSIVLIALLALGPHTRAAAQACGGDCNGDGVVNVSELTLIVKILLGNENVSSCRAADTNQDNEIKVAEAITAVLLLLDGCPANTVTVQGICRQPGGTGSIGFRNCDPGTAINAYRCTEKKNCLMNPARVRIAFGEVLVDGTFSLQIDRDVLFNPAFFIYYEALIDGAVAFRAFGIGGAGNFAGLGPYGNPMVRVDISPFSEAAVRILEDEGLENFSDDGIARVTDTVARAAAGISYASFSPEEAVTRAEQRANADPEVDLVIMQEKATPTPGPPITSTPTLTRTPTPTPTSTFTPTLPPPRALAFVAYGQDALAVLDLDTRTVVGTPLPVGPDPRGVRASPDGRLILVANERGDNVTVIDARRRTIIGSTVDPRFLPADQPKVAVASADNLVYVVNSGTNFVDVYDFTGVADGAPIPTPRATIAVGDRPLDIAIGTGFALVTNNADRSLSVIDTAHEVRRVPLGHPVSQIALTPDEAYAYVTTEGAGGASTREVVAIDVAKAVAGTLGSNDRRIFTLGSDPRGVAVLPDPDGGTHVFVVSSGDDRIDIIERGPGNPFGTPLSPAPLSSGSQPNAIAVIGNGSFAYVTNSARRAVFVIDTALAIADQLDTPTTISNVGEMQYGIAVVNKPPD